VPHRGKFPGKTGEQRLRLVIGSRRKSLSIDDYALTWPRRREESHGVARKKTSNHEADGQKSRVPSLSKEQQLPLKQQTTEVEGYDLVGVLKRALLGSEKEGEYFGIRSAGFRGV